MAQCSVVCHVAATYVILCHTTIELGLELASQSYSGVMLSHAESCCPRTADGQAMVEGTRVECIIGATRIRDFSTATEVQLFFCQVTGELVGLNC